MIYLITQNRQFGHYLSEYLREKGYEVILADDGTQGSQEIIQCSPSVVLLDLYLNDPSGLEVLHVIRDGGFKGKIILLAGVSLSRILPEAFPFGIHQVMGEHVDVGPIESAIRSALETEHEQTHFLSSNLR